MFLVWMKYGLFLVNDYLFQIIFNLSIQNNASVVRRNQHHRTHATSHAEQGWASEKITNTF